MKKSAGLVIIQDDKVLLGHPTRASWKHSFSLPKGHIEDNEDKIEAAIRETYEEVGIKVDKSMIEQKWGKPEEHIIEYRDKHHN